MNPILQEDFERIAGDVDMSRFAGRRILITGAAGFVGSYMTALFHQSDAYVAGMDNFVTGANVGGGYLLNRDISKPDAFRNLQGFDYVVNLASIASRRAWLAKPMETVAVNTIGVWNLVHWARAASLGVKKVLHASSVEVYGEPGDVIPTPESFRGSVDCDDENSVYTESKRMSETICMAAYRQFQLPIVVVRPFNIYGLGEPLNNGRVIPTLMKAMLEKKLFAVHGTSKVTRSYCYISDAVMQILVALLDGEPGEAYNVGDQNCELSVLDLVAAAERAIGRKVVLTVTPGLDEGIASRRKPDTAKVKALRVPHLFCRVPLEEGLRRTFESYIAS